MVSLIAGVPFYVNAKFLEDPRSGFTKSVPNTKALLLRLMPLKGLEREMEDAIRREDYEYAELIKQERRPQQRRRGRLRRFGGFRKRIVIMHVFYTPDIAQTLELPEEEAGHCLRVLRWEWVRRLC